MATLAVGDIQGCYDRFLALLKRAHFRPAQDRLWLVGDLVNRGPKSLEVLRYVRDLGDRAVTVLGNHDLHLVALAYGHGRPRQDDTLDRVLAARDLGELVDWLRQRPLLHREGDRILVHAGLLPQWSPAQAQRLAREVEQALRDPSHAGFIAAMYGSKPERWNDELAGNDRLRVIVNAMTRMRFCTAQGAMEFHSKGNPTAPPKGYLPWFQVPRRRSARTCVICGHWSALGLCLTPRLIALDTGCVWGGKLSAVRLEDGKVYQV